MRSPAQAQPNDPGVLCAGKGPGLGDLELKRLLAGRRVPGRLGDGVDLVIRHIAEKFAGFRQVDVAHLHPAHVRIAPLQLPLDQGQLGAERIRQIKGQKAANHGGALSLQQSAFSTPRSPRALLRLGTFYQPS